MIGPSLCLFVCRATRVIRALRWCSVPDGSSLFKWRPSRTGPVGRSVRADFFITSASWLVSLIRMVSTCRMAQSLTGAKPDLVSLKFLVRSGSLISRSSPHTACFGLGPPFRCFRSEQSCRTCLLNVPSDCLLFLQHLGLFRPDVLVELVPVNPSHLPWTLNPTVSLVLPDLISLPFSFHLTLRGQEFSTLKGQSYLT